MNEYSHKVFGTKVRTDNTLSITTYNPNTEIWIGDDLVISCHANLSCHANYGSIRRFLFRVLLGWRIQNLQKSIEDI